VLAWFRPLRKIYDYGKSFKVKFYFQAFTYTNTKNWRIFRASLERFPIAQARPAAVRPADF